MQHSLSPGFYGKRPSEDDFDALLEMLQLCSMADFGKIKVSESQLRNIWGLPGHDLAQDAWLIFAPGDRLAGMTFVGHLPPISRLFAAMQVHPDYVGLELYDYLLKLSLERARALVTEAREEVRVSLGIGIPEKSAEHRQVLKGAGFEHVRSQWVMSIAMDQPSPEPVWPEDIELRSYTSDLLRAVYEADEEAFQDHWGHVQIDFETWEHFAVKQENFDPGLWFLAFDGEEIAGYALCSYKQEQDEGWVDSLGVRRPWRHKGLGLALLHHAFGEFYRRGERKVSLNVDSQNLTGATRLYTRAGMHVALQVDTYELELRPGIELSTQELAV